MKRLKSYVQDILMKIMLICIEVFVVLIIQKTTSLKYLKIKHNRSYDVAKSIKFVRSTNLQGTHIKQLLWIKLNCVPGFLPLRFS